MAAGEDVEAMGQLGQLYQHTGRRRDAMAIYTQMAHKAPNDTGVLLSFVSRPVLYWLASPVSFVVR